MRIIYAGTPEFAVPALQALAASQHEVVGVYTQPDRAAGRGQKIHFSPVKACALAQGLDVYQPLSFREQSAIDQLSELNADLMVVAAYGVLLPSSILEAPRLGCINIHASLLPRWRGAAPIQRAILAGDNETGITLMQMDIGLDTGAMLAKTSLALRPEHTSAQVHDELKQIGARLLMDNLDRIENGSLKPEQQLDSEATYAHKLKKQEALMDWKKDASELHREVRAFNPWPVSYTHLQGQSIKVWSAEISALTTKLKPGQVIAHERQGISVACGHGVLIITEMQFAGKKKTSADQVLNSRNLSDETFAS